MNQSPDLLIAGAGILGLATAYQALKQGKSVTVIDRSDRPVGASIQNFGHACFTGQADIIQPVAARAQAGWTAAARDAGLWASQPGTVIPAATELEYAVLEEFAAHRGAGDITLLDRDGLAAAIGNPDLAVVGGAHLPRDMRVNPRQAAWRLAEYLAAQGVQFQWNTRINAAGDGVVATSRGDFTGHEVVVCPGHHITEVFPAIADAHQVRHCTLAMALITKPDRIPHDLGMLTGTSLARYDGFTAMPSAAALRVELAERHPDLVDCVANLMVTAIPEGLLVGDSHHYDLSPTPFVDAEVAELLLRSAAEILGIDQPQVLQRWQGTYADSPATNLILEHLDERTTVAVVTSGIGMTLSFGIAELILNHDTVPDF